MRAGCAKEQSLRTGGQNGKRSAAPFTRHWLSEAAVSPYTISASRFKTRKRTCPPRSSRHCTSLAISPVSNRWPRLTRAPIRRMRGGERSWQLRFERSPGASGSHAGTSSSSESRRGGLTRCATSRRQRERPAPRRRDRLQQPRYSFGKRRDRPGLHIKAGNARGIERFGKHSIVTRESPSPESPGLRQRFTIHGAIGISKHLNRPASNPPQLNLTIRHLRKSQAGIIGQGQVVDRVSANRDAWDGRQLPDLVGDHRPEPDGSLAAPFLPPFDDVISLLE